MASTRANAVYNFCSGPAMLPFEAMKQAQAEFLSYHQSGVSIMEMSHRSEAFLSILNSAENNLRSLLSVPDNYKVIFMQGGASLQFSAVPLNLIRPNKSVGFLDTGYWSQKAMAETKRFGRVELVASTESTHYKSALGKGEYRVGCDLSYLHYTPNETIGGVQYNHIPEAGSVPLVADMSSCILSEPIDVNNFGLIYAGAQKNIGPAGLAVVIVREDLIGQHLACTPRLLDYQEVCSQKSMANTPPTFAIYLADLVFKWLIDQGGLPAIAERNEKKSALLYRAIDGSQLFFNDVEASYRSKMNVPFFLHDKTLADLFLSSAECQGLLNLKGHRSQGGFRASIYNAMPLEGVEALIEFIQKFENKYV